MALGDGIRRNLGTVSQEERERLRKAIVKLHTEKHYPGARGDTPVGGVSFWFKQNEIHAHTHVHGVPAFVPWHRELLNRFEALIRKVDPELSLHYWDWTQDPQKIPDGARAPWRAGGGDGRARALVASGGVRPETRPDVYETLSRCYLAMNHAHAAAELLKDCIAEVDKDERHATAQIRYRSFLATTLAAMGAIEQARRVLDEATERAERLGGFGERVALQWERARLFWMQGDGDAALSTLTYARALAQLVDDTLQIARAHLFSAQILNLERREAEAGPHLERAERLLDFGDDAVDRGALRAEQAKHEAAVGDPGQALTLAREAVELLSEHVLHTSNAWHAMGAAHAAVGDVNAADADYDRAVTALTDREQWREAVYVARAWAATLRAADREERAYAVLELAAALGQRVPAPHVPPLIANAETRPRRRPEPEPRRSRA